MCGEMAPEARRGLSSAEKYPRGVRFGPPRRLSPGADLRSRVTGSAARAMDRRWTRLWTRSLAHLTVQRYQCCASDGLSSCPQPLCPYWVRVSPHARMPLTATAEPAGESFPGPPYDAVRPASANAHRKLIRSSTDIPAVIVPLTVRAPSPVQRHGVGPFHQLSRRPLRSQDEGAEDATLHTPYPFVVLGGHLGLFPNFHAGAFDCGRRFSPASTALRILVVHSQGQIASQNSLMRSSSSKSWVLDGGWIWPIDVHNRRT